MALIMQSSTIGKCTDFYCVIMALNPRDSGEHIVAHAKSLTVKPEGIVKLTEAVINGLISKQIDIENFSQHQYHPTANDPIASNFVFLIDTLNFCFWTPGEATKWKVNGETGYFALCAAIKRALNEGIDITNPRFYAKLTHEELSQILRGDDPACQCPLLSDRVQCLHEVADKLLSAYDGSFQNCIRKANRSAQALLRLVIDEFPCFRDEAFYAGQRVSMYKRAQILIGDIWSCYRGQGLGAFDDIETVTMFADYRVPQVLVYFGALEYSADLLELLKKDTMLLNGCAEEVEIRGASIYIVEELKNAVVKEIRQNHPHLSMKNVNSILLDHFLWDYRRKFAAELEHIPFHKTISIYY